LFFAHVPGINREERKGGRKGRGREGRGTEEERKRGREGERGGRTETQVSHFL
jgi:hypothetical protein